MREIRLAPCLDCLQCKHSKKKDDGLIQRAITLNSTKYLIYIFDFMIYIIS